MSFETLLLFPDLSNDEMNMLLLKCGYFTIVKEEKVSRLKLKALATVNSQLVFPRRRSEKDI